MNRIFELFRGGVIFEVTSLKQAEKAEQAGAVAILLNFASSPIHPDGNRSILESIFEKIDIPVLASYHPGHTVEAEILHTMGVWGLYSDSRLHPITGSKLTEKVADSYPFPVIADMPNLETWREHHDHFVPVLRNEESLEELLMGLAEKKDDEFVFVAGPIETISDIALLRRKGADVLMVPQNVFKYPDAGNYVKKLVKASLYFDDTEKLAELLHKEEEKGEK